MNGGAAVYTSAMDREKVELLFFDKGPMSNEVVEIPFGDAEEKKFSHQSETRNRFLSLEWDEQCYFADGRRQDSMAIVTRFGKPDYFVTMTCNPQWLEITTHLKPGQTAFDAPDLTARVFHQKHATFMKDMTERNIVGQVIAWIYVIEWQKRGLPHAHMLFTMAEEDKPDTPEKIDRVISAQLPNIDDPMDPRHNIFVAVAKHNLHRKCGPGSPCWDSAKNVCTKGFPKVFTDETVINDDGFPSYCRPNNGVKATVQAGNRTETYDNSSVVPYNPFVSVRFDCHCNWEVSCTIGACKYLYKYVYKGSDQASVRVEGEAVDEIKEHINGRYICPPEACHRLFGFPIQGKSHAVIHLLVHLPNMEPITFEKDKEAEALARERNTTLLAFFKLILEWRQKEAAGADLGPVDPRTLYYHQLPEHFTFVKKDGIWKIKGRYTSNIGRVFTVSPKDPERYALRLLLFHKKDCGSFEELRTVNGVVEDSFASAARTMGLLQGERCLREAMDEAVIFSMPSSLRGFFATLINFAEATPAEAQAVWDDYKDDLAADYLRRIANPIIAYARAYYDVLDAVDSSVDFPALIQPPMDQRPDEDDDQQFDHAREYQDRYGKLNAEQKIAVDSILDTQGTKLALLDGPGGSGKTFVYETIYHKLRSEGKKVLCLAWTGIAASLLPNGRTICSVFKMNTDDDCRTSYLKPNRKEGKFLKEFDTFIIDECSMLSHWMVETMERTLREVHNTADVFGGRRILMGGDFRQIDYVLAYEEDPGFVIECLDIDGDIELSESAPEKASGSSVDPEIEKRRRRREYFEMNLTRMGLELERREIDPLLGKTKFTLVHAPFCVLEKQAQILGVKLPVKECDLDFRDTRYFPGIVDSTLAKFKLFDFDDADKKLLEEPEYYMAQYSADRRQHFVNWDRPDILFPNAERSRMVYDLLCRANYDSPNQEKRDHKHFGIERLLSSYTYNAAYPLHQILRPEIEIGRSKEISQREVLMKYWVSWRNIFKYQPLDCIKRYFGSKIAFYFAWLGYYTRSLYWAAFVGIICVVYGLFNISVDIPSNDICGTDGIGATAVLCPACETFCDFQRLNNSCYYAKVSYLFDNTGTVIFAAIMSIWATLFLEGWKRYHAEIAWKWGLMDIVVDEDTVRPDFQFRVKTTRFNPVTGEDEPYLSTKKRIANFFASGATVLFFILLVLAVVFGMIVYRVIVFRMLAWTENAHIDKAAFLIVSVSAATINLIVILMMNYVYNEIALRLTRWECPRTQADFDNSYTFKVFLFQFVNYYSSLFYIAFFKGLLSQLPGARDNDGNFKIGGLRLEGCDAAGCFAELVIQLAIIMCGKQFFSAIVEFFYPLVMGLLRKWQFGVPAVVETKEEKLKRLREEKNKKTGNTMKRWESDYFLNPTYDQFLFDEYLEMVLQFGFVTLFVAAFPLAPLFAVINNIMEIRIDAYKFLCTTQRPMPAQARNIGVWFAILDVLSRVSVTINALVIAFTSDFVPKTMYTWTNPNNNNHTLTGYVEYSLSYFDASQFNKTKNAEFQGLEFCRFRGFRRPPCNLTVTHFGAEVEKCDDFLGFSYEWWKIFAARLLFVVIFEHIVFLIKVIVEYLIPDIPTRIFLAQQRERYLIRKALLGDLSGATSPRSQSQSAAHEDREDVAFQPGNFRVKRPDHETPQRSSRKETSSSLDSFHTAVGAPSDRVPDGK